MMNTGAPENLENPVASGNFVWNYDKLNWEI